jgi:hypothetical protein
VHDADTRAHQHRALTDTGELEELRRLDRARVFGESEKNGLIVEQVTTTILRPAAFSPMK